MSGLTPRQLSQSFAANSLATGIRTHVSPMFKTEPNVPFLMADVWSAQLFGFAGDTNARTPTFGGFARKASTSTKQFRLAPFCRPVVDPRANIVIERDIPHLDVRGTSNASLQPLEHMRLAITDAKLRELDEQWE